MKNVILFLFLSITFYSCGVKKSLLKTNYEIHKIAVNGNVNNIEIIDKRTDATSRELKIPTISFPGQSDIIKPSLTQAHTDSIKKQIKSYFSINQDNINVRVEIIKGFKEFIANAFNEREYVQFDTKITVLNLSNNQIKSCSSTAFFEVKSMDASHKFMNKIYLKAMRNAIYKCFEKLTE